MDSSTKIKNSEFNIFIRKLNVANFELTTIKLDKEKHKGRSNVDFAAKSNENRDKIEFEMNYKYIYDIIPVSVDFELYVQVELDEPFDYKDDEGLKKILDKSLKILIPKFDEKITAINELLSTDMPPLKLAMSKSKGEDE
jgi:hypothetical protein